MHCARAEQQLNIATACLAHPSPRPPPRSFVVLVTGTVVYGKGDEREIAEEIAEGGGAYEAVEEAAAPGERWRRSARRLLAAGVLPTQTPACHAPRMLSALHSPHAHARMRRPRHPVGAGAAGRPGGREPAHHHGGILRRLPQVDSKHLCRQRLAAVPQPHPPPLKAGRHSSPPMFQCHGIHAAMNGHSCSHA